MTAKRIQSLTYLSLITRMFVRQSFAHISWFRRQVATLTVATRMFKMGTIILPMSVVSTSLAFFHRTHRVTEIIEVSRHRAITKSMSHFFAIEARHCFRTGWYGSRDLIALNVTRHVVMWMLSFGVEMVIPLSPVAHRATNMANTTTSDKRYLSSLQI